MSEETRPIRGGCTRETCAIVSIVDAHGAQLQSLIEQVERVQARKTDHEARISTLESIQETVIARVDRAENSIADTSRMLHELKGEVHGLKVIVTNVSITAESTYQTLKEHVANYARDLESTTGRMERQSQKITKAIGLVGGVLVVLAMIHSAMSGQSLPDLIMKLISGLGL